MCARTNDSYTCAVQTPCRFAEADRDITDYSGNKPMDYLKHQTTVSASTYSSEYAHHPLHPTNSDASPWSAASGADNFASATGTIKSRRTGGSGGSVRATTLHRLRSQRKRFATTDGKSGSGGGSLTNSRSANAGGLTTSQSMVDTTAAAAGGQSMLSSGSESSMMTVSADQAAGEQRRGSVFVGPSQKSSSSSSSSKRANRMYQSFLFRGKSAGSKSSDL